MMVTLLLKHHPGLTLEDVQSRLKASDWWEQFPPPGVRISARAFGRDWRYPITSGYRPGES